jgi:hypothetical protein
MVGNPELKKMSISFILRALKLHPGTCSIIRVYCTNEKTYDMVNSYLLPAIEV